MPIRIAAAFFLCSGTLAAAQQPAAQAPAAQMPTFQQLLDSGYDLKAVQLTTGPCGNQPANRARQCPREMHYLQSPRKDTVYRCEMGDWNGKLVQECRRV